MLRTARKMSALPEWQVRLDARHICIVNARRFAQPAFALCVFRREQMASGGVRSQHFATRRDLEALGYGFTCLAACDGLWHKG